MKVLQLLGAVVVVALAFLGLLWWSQERIVWQPPGGVTDEAGARVRRVNYRAEDGQPLFAYVVTPDAGAARGLMLSFHGNAEVALWAVPWAEEVARRTGWAVVLPEYRGYAGLPGRPSYAGSGLDARAALRAARASLGGGAAGGGPAPPVAPPLVLHGYSLGSAVAAELADEARSEAIVLAAPFTSARDMARAFLPGPAIGVWPLVGRVRFDTEARVAAVGAPVWVTHGAADRVIPVRMGEAVFRAAREKGELLLVAGAGHGDLTVVGGERYWAWLGRALSGAERR